MARIALHALLLAERRRPRASRSRQAIPVEQIALLLAVAADPGRRPCELLEELAVPPSTFTTWLNCLEDRGLIRRERDVQDRRMRRVLPTPRGEELAEAARRAFERALSWATDRELGSLERSLSQRLRAQPSRPPAPASS